MRGREGGPAPGGLRPIDRALAEATRQAAGVSERRRAVHTFHEPAEAVQRLINAIEPDSYIQPHKHEQPDKIEVFLALAGAALIVLYDDAGRPVEHTIICAGGPVWGVDIPPRRWHSLIALEPGSVFYEIIEGPYRPENHKTFAPWAPAGGDAGRQFNARIIRQLGIEEEVWTHQRRS